MQVLIIWEFHQENDFLLKNDRRSVPVREQIAAIDDLKTKKGYIYSTVERFHTKEQISLSFNL